MGFGKDFRRKGSSRGRHDAITRWDTDHRERKRRHDNGFHSYPRRRRSPFGFLREFYGIAALLALGLFAAWQQMSPTVEPYLVSSFTTASYERPAERRTGQSTSTHFPLCASARRTNCVVDGDTFWLNGEKIRISDIDAPEVSRPRSVDEARRGREATLRLQRQLNSGRIELRTGGRDKDKYGRSLRTVHVNGRSVGETMVREGHARPWN